MKKFKSIKILFVYLACSSILVRYPLWSSLGIIFIIYFLNFSEINKDFRNFRFSNIKYLWLCVPMIVLNYSLLYLISKVSPLPQNEVLIRSLINLNPVLYSLVFGILAPISEELTFRYGFNGIKNKYVYIIFTSLFFAAIHLASFSEILYIIPYFIMGLTFAYSYRKTDCLIYSIIIHVISNLVSILFILV